MSFSEIFILRIFRRKRKRRDQEQSTLDAKESLIPDGFNLPRIPPPISLLNAVVSNQELTTFPDHRLQERACSAGMKYSVDEKKQENFEQTIESVKAETQSFDISKHNYALKNFERVNVEKYASNGTILDACRRYGINGSTKPHAEYPVNPMSHIHTSKQNFNSGTNGKQNLASLQNQCVPSAFSFSVNNLFQPNSKI